MVAAAQLYLRFFGLPMKSVVTKKLNEILEGLKGTLSQNAIEHWKKVQASSSTSWDEISFSITPLQRQLAGPMERLCNNVKYLPSCDAEAVKQTIKRVSLCLSVIRIYVYLLVSLFAAQVSTLCFQVADITSDSIKELKESLPEKPSDNDIQQQHEVERNDDEDNPGKSSCYEDEDFEDEVDKSTWCNRDIALSHECLGMLNDALTVLLHLMSNVSTAAKEWYQLIRHIDENVTGCNLPEQVQNIMGKDLEWLTATNEAVSAFEGILVDFAYAADTLEEVSPAANQMKVQLDDMLSLWEHYAERIEDVDNLRMARRSLGLEKVKEFKAKIEDRIAAMEKYL